MSYSVYTTTDNLLVSSTATVDITAHDGNTKGLKLGGTLVTATASEINASCHISGRLVNLTAATLTMSNAVHGERIVTVNRAAGSALTLPAATGSGTYFRVFIGTSITSNTTTIVTASGSDFMVGFQNIIKNGTTTPQVYNIPVTSRTLTLNGTTQGGLKGDIIELVDVATNLWLITETLQGSGVLIANYS